MVFLIPTMSAPTLRNLDLYRQILPEICLPDSWEISTSKSDDVIWNVVLAYLNSFSLSDEDELTRRIQCLTGCQEVNKNIKYSIEMCNPFLHRDASFCDTEISELVAKFKKRVQENINNLADNFRYFEMSSKLLSCNIVLISLKDKIATVFPSFLYGNHISILDNSNYTKPDGRIQDHFSFCIPKETGMEKKKHALLEILKSVEKTDNIEEAIQNVSELPEITEDFLISLLKNGFGHVVPAIYETPYVLSKLEYAGFQTDPRIEDKTGQSAISHALKTGNSYLVSVLYDHVANGRLQTNASVRFPDLGIVENLKSLRIHLESLEKHPTFENVSEKSRCLFRDLCRFNEFQIEMCENIYDIRTQINDETEKIYKTILIILKTYQNYFHYRNVNSPVDQDETSLFKKFLEYKFYFKKLDFIAAVMFFDNLFLLKKRLKLSEDAYLNVESNFCLHVYLKKILGDYKKEKRFYYASQWIIFQERLSLERILGRFKEILENTELSEDNIVKKFPEETVRTLTNLPEMYGEFLMSRFKHYLNVATTTRLDTETENCVKSFQSILVIERCLQVLGEGCRNSDFNSIQSIVTLALSTNSSKHLNAIRDSLSHIEDNELLNRIQLEKDVELFIEIKKDLMKFETLFITIYSAHKYELNKFLLSRFKKTICDAQRIRIWEDCENPLKAIFPISEIENNQLLVPKNSCKSWECSFDDMKASLDKKIDDLFCKGDILRENTVNDFKYLLQNMVSFITEVLKNLKASVPEEAVKELDCPFWCLESILIYITTDRELDEQREMLRLMLNNRIELFSKLSEKTTDSIACRNHVAKGNRVLKQESSVSDENCKIIMNSIDPFLKHGVCLKINEKWRKELEDNRFLYENAEGSKTNRVDNESIRNESGSLENIYTKELEESVNRLEISEPVTLTAKDIPKATILKKENCLSFLKASAFQDNCLRAEVDHNDQINSLTEDITYKNSFETSYFVEDIKKVLENYKEIRDTVFRKFPRDSNKDFKFKNIENYSLMHKRKNLLEKKEREFILTNVPKQFQNIPKLKQEIRVLLKEKGEFTKELNNKLSILKLKNQDIKEIKRELERGVIDETLHILDTAPDYYLKIKEAVESEELLEKEEYLTLCEKLELSDDVKDKLSQLLTKPTGNKLEFLRDRIKMLKTILIDENNDVRKLWESTIPGSKKEVRERVIQLYLKDNEMQASVETLLFHCMSLSRNTKLKKQWEKTNSLFSGINLRNVLAHGHPLMETLGQLLDPYDLPSKLVEKMFQLISDESVIDCMQQILQKSGKGLKGFLKIMEEEENNPYKTLCEQILKCDHWKSYAVLMPVNSGRNA